MYDQVGRNVLDLYETTSKLKGNIKIINNDCASILLFALILAKIYSDVPHVELQ